MDLKNIRRLIKLVEASDIEELEIREEGLQVRITKKKEIPVPQVFQPSSVIPSPTQNAPPAQYETQVYEAKIEPLPGTESDNVVEICSPMVGTFYRAPAPDANAYVEVGSHIEPGKILCIIEAMKLMNEIEAEVSGKIVKILVQNAQPVEYNQPLFLVEKS
ncbi:acetyl-CoA carboxylase biotin carboxyl carrier protein [bacterium]|nr:acetyl-CoA carboxylase biotin carboxyl carrier protein [bacterium]RQV93719.1 MAG: acetyl-CoA carboxylase biotin carboxyl carrier protein [bacterium]